jgi:hypothetical protein
MSDVNKLAMDLLAADSEKEVVAILTAQGYWNNPDCWRLYGDKEGNFGTVGNQAALPEAAIVEKIVNCCDSRLMLECTLRGADPESKEAPKSVRDAVRTFFDGKGSSGSRGGTLADWSPAKRTEQSRFITIAATGDRPSRGRSSNKMCLTIVDQAEGQSAQRLPRTIFSFSEKNKQRIRFVQGKFNMGGSGALRYCGTSGIQLVISRRHPSLATKEASSDPTAMDWTVTVTRREEPTSKSGDPVHSEYTYLAPLGARETPRKGLPLHFSAESLSLMPDMNEPYVRSIKWGTAIKLYEYNTTVGQSNVLMADGLMYALERLLPEIALPVRIHECRAGYKGEKERSFETPIAGLVVRLEEGRGDNLEAGFPLSVQIHAADTNLRARIYAFKEKSATTYLADEGVIFSINGQAHGYLPKSIFSRPKAVGLPRLKDSLLVLVDCSELKTTKREDLFMSSRDRLSKNPLRFAIEREIEELLRTNSELKKLQQERREKDVESKLNEEKPLEEVLNKIFVSSPALKTLFLRGQRLARPFAGGAGDGNGHEERGPSKGDKAFEGKRHPTYFRIPNVPVGSVYRRNCELGRRCQIRFETDVVNDYFDREADKGTFALEIIESSRAMAPPSFSLGLEDGIAHLNMAIPPEAEVGDELTLQASVMDATLVEPLVSLVKLTIHEKQDRPPGPPRKKQLVHGGGPGATDSQQGIQLPTIIPVREGDVHWNRHKFVPADACLVISDPVEIDGKSRLEHTFYINIDNVSLKTEMKYAKQDARLLEAKFKYANVLMGLAVLHEAEGRGEVTPTSHNGNRIEEALTEEYLNGQSPQDTIRKVSSAVAPVVIPLIDQLSGLSEEQLEELSARGDDAH